MLDSSVVSRARGGGRESRRAELVRERVAQAALDLFLQKGFVGTGVRQIASAADVSVGTIFNYFGAKEDILFAIISEMQKGVAIPLQIAATQYRTRAVSLGEDPEVCLLALLDEYGKAVEQWSRHLLLSHQEAHCLPAAQLRQILDGERRMRDLLADLIQIGVERGKFTAGDLRLRAHAVQVLIQSWVTRRWALDGVPDFAAFLRMVERAMIAMLHAPEQPPSADAPAARPGTRARSGS